MDWRDAQRPKNEQKEKKPCQSSPEKHQNMDAGIASSSITIPTRLQEEALTNFEPRKSTGPLQADVPEERAQPINIAAILERLSHVASDKAQQLKHIYRQLADNKLSIEACFSALRTLVGNELVDDIIDKLEDEAARKQQHLKQLQKEQEQPQQRQKQTKASLEQFQQQQRATPQLQNVGQHQTHQPLQKMHSSLGSSIHYQATTQQPPKPSLQSGYRQEHLYQMPAASGSLSLQQMKPQADKYQVSESQNFAKYVSSSSFNVEPQDFSRVTTDVPAVCTTSSVVYDMQTSVLPTYTPTDRKRPADVFPNTKTKRTKQNLGGDVLEESIHQLTDVTALSRLNLHEGQDRLLSGWQEQSQCAQTNRRFQQEGKGGSLLNRVPMQTKINAIAAKHGISGISSDAENCLSMSVEERLRNMLYKLARIAGRRSDQEKEMHKLVVTCDIQKQIFLIRKTAKDAQDTKQAQEQSRKDKEKPAQNGEASKEGDTNSQTKEKKSQKGNEGNQVLGASKETAEILSKWVFMAEQGKKKRKETMDAKTQSATRQTMDGRATTGQIAIEKAARNARKTEGYGFQTKPSLTIMVKDLLAYLETEPQMAKSSVVFHLQNKKIGPSRVG